MTFSLQHRQLAGALEQAGLCPKASAQIAGILCNGAQPLLHSGPMTHDSTPPSMRRVTPDVRKHVLPKLDFEEGDPDYVRPKIAPSEEEPPVEPPPNVVTTLAPQQADGVFRVQGGNLSDAAAAGDGVRVDVRSKVARKPAGGLPMAMIDQQSNRLVGKRLRATVTEGGERLQAEVRENNEDVAINLSFRNLANYDVVTGVEYVPGTGLRITSETLTAWNAREKNVRWIYTQDADVLTNLADDLHGFRAHAKRIPVFEQNAMRNEHLYFNVFRIGTFTGGWAKGASKSVDQVWPAEGRTLTVKNLTQAIPDTDETKYVLFAPRTQDKVNEGTDEETGAPYPIDVRGELEKPILNEYPPVVEYIALEIQAATDDCTAFNYLLGKKVNGLPGYVSGQCQALVHDRESDCLQWGGQVLNVITNVVVSPAAITFMQRPVYVLCYDDEVQGVTIPIEACPPPPPPPPPECGPCSWVWTSPSSGGYGWTIYSECDNVCVCEGPPSSDGTYDGEIAYAMCQPAP